MKRTLVQLALFFWFSGPSVSFALVWGSCRLCTSVYRVLMRGVEATAKGGCRVGSVQLDGAGDCGE